MAQELRMDGRLTGLELMAEGLGFLSGLEAQTARADWELMESKALGLMEDWELMAQGLESQLGSMARVEARGSECPLESEAQVLSQSLFQNQLCLKLLLSLHL